MGRCKRCDGRGFVDRYYGSSNSWTPTISQCPDRCDISGYSNEVQRRLNDQTRVTSHLVKPAALPVPNSSRPVAPVIPLRRPVVDDR